MTNNNSTLQYYLYSASNLIAAFGGGMVLAKCMGVINDPLLTNASVVAFFVGSLIGLTLLQATPKSWSKMVACSFSILGGVTSIVLYFLYKNNELNGVIGGVIAYLFFITLCVRFAFWFFSRVLRASAAAGCQQNIAWVEFGYYLGIILGLIVWQFCNIHISLASVLLMDAVVQFIAGIMDIIAIRFNKAMVANDQKHVNASITNTKIDNSKNQKKQSNLCWRMAIVVALLTVGTQVVIFEFSHQLATTAGSYIIAAFYAGVAVAAAICKRFITKFEWTNHLNSKIFQARLSFSNSTTQWSVSYLSMLLICAFFTCGLCAGIYLWQLNSFWLIMATFIAAFCYEINALALLDRIGFEGKAMHKRNFVIHTYSLMSIFAAISIILFEVIEISFSSSLFVVSACIIASFYLLFRKGVRP